MEFYTEVTAFLTASSRAFSLARYLFTLRQEVDGVAFINLTTFRGSNIIIRLDMLVLTAGLGLSHRGHRAKRRHFCCTQIAFDKRLSLSKISENICQPSAIEMSNPPRMFVRVREIT